MEVDQHNLDLEQTLDTKRLSARKKDDDVKAARELISSLQSTIASNSQMYRNWA